MATGKDSAIYKKGTAVNSYKAFLHELGKHLTKKNIAELKFVSELPGRTFVRLNYHQGSALGRRVS